MQDVEVIYGTAALESDRLSKEGHVTAAKLVLEPTLTPVMANASAKRIGASDLYTLNTYLMKLQQIKMRAQLKF